MRGVTKPRTGLSAPLVRILAWTDAHLGLAEGNSAHAAGGLGVSGVPGAESRAQKTIYSRWCVCPLKFFELKRGRFYPAPF